VNISGPSPAGTLAPNISPSPLTVQVPAVPPKHHRSYKVVLFPAIGALVTGLAGVLMIVLILLIRRKSKELEKIEGNAWSFSCVKKGQEGKHFKSFVAAVFILLLLFARLDVQLSVTRRQCWI
jgi:hypothetical protein